MSLVFGTALRGAEAGARVMEYLKSVPAVPVSGGSQPADLNGSCSVTFDKVSFAYPSRPDQTILRDFEFELPAGKVVAICGPSGSGKSTVAGLVERFYDPSAGAVKFNDHNLRDLDPSWVRGSLIGYINQEPVLFAGTIEQNIRYGCRDATKEQIVAAAKLANAHSFIEGFPEGYHTVVGERGATVSGGQRQRIAIARALLKNPRVLILDEATSALDAQSESIVQDAMNKLQVGRTVLVIAHRLSTIQNADVIAVLREGAVVEHGTHAELLSTDGLYADLVRRQTSVTTDDAIDGRVPVSSCVLL
jgi:ATP-binding cassette subfamily B (MDR/TAP) protein 8